MERKEEIRRMWRECFPGVERQWVEMFLSTAFAEEDLHVTTDAEGRLVSSLLLQPYSMTFYGRDVKAAYLSFACTMPRYRAMGSMRHLLWGALRTARDGGAMAVWLVPAADWLRDYYERAGGWATVVYTREDNYTSVHQFDGGGYRPLAEVDADALYEAFSRLERTQGDCVVLHSRRDFDMVCADCVMEGGEIVGVADGEGHIAAVAAGYPDDFYRVVTVKMAAGVDDHAVNAALETLRLHYPGKRITVERPASDSDTGGRRRRLTPGGMVRIVNVEECLDIIARHAPKGWRKVVRVTDHVIPENNHTYLMRGGRGAVIDDTLHPSDLNGFDVDVSVLARMVFGSRTIGEIIDFPGTRPVMNLMLE